MERNEPRRWAMSDPPSSGGRDARSPKPMRWRDVLLRLKRDLSEDDISLVAAGVAFYAFLAFFPGLAALVSIWGLFADPATVEIQLSELRAVPPDVRDMLVQQATSVAGASSSSLSIGVVIGILGTLWSAGKGASSLVRAMNIAYEEEEKRGYVRLTLLSLGLTLLGVVLLLVALALVGLVPAVLGSLGLGFGETLVVVGRWPALGLLMMAWLAVLYRVGPSRENAHWQWVSPGAAVAAVLWLLGSAGFSYYVAKFGNYNETYGAVGAVVVLLLWLFVTAFVVLLGAELNSELEHQTGRDSTTGPEEPMGQRGATVADTLGEVP